MISVSFHTLFISTVLASTLLEGVQGASRCDSLVPEYCALPYPNSYFTVATQDTPTGVRLNLSEGTFPTNTLGEPMKPYKWNRFGT